MYVPLAAVLYTTNLVLAAGYGIRRTYDMVNKAQITRRLCPIRATILVLYVCPLEFKRPPLGIGASTFRYFSCCEEVILLYMQ